MVLFITILVTAVLMEAVAWAMHKYIMHGFFWNLHEDHHVTDKHDSFFELNDSFFVFFAVNMSMVMGLAPVVGVPLPLVSYGGSAMLVLMGAFGLVQSAHVHRPRGVLR